jgi:hypothetical protein
MNTFAAQELNNLLSELTQADTIESDFRFFRRYAKDMALGRIRIKTQKEVRT